MILYIKIIAEKIDTKEKLAIKFESIKAQYPLVIYEANVNLILHGINQKVSHACNHIYDAVSVEGFSKIYSFGQHKESFYMTMDLLGPSLADLFQFCGYKFSLKTTLMIACQLIKRFEYLHSRNFVHRDIKPDNFLMGLGNKSNLLYVVDMGLAKRYFDPNSQQHIAFRNDKSLTGTARYASLHAHLGEELSRRDDLESIGYVLVYFYTGYLPW